jgi:hypothetical protein
MYGNANHEKADHDRFMEGMPPAPELILKDLPWAEPLSEDEDEDRRLRQKQVAADNAAFYRQVLAEYRKRCPSIWTRLLRWCGWPKRG